MPVSHALSLGLLMLAALFVPAISEADEIKAVQPQAIQDANVALQRVNASINASPQDAQALFTKGLMLVKQKRVDDAIRIFTEITQKYPDLPEPYNNLAVLYANQGHYDKAKNALEAALRTNPSYATAHRNLGEIYAQMASEAYDKALQLDSNPRAQTKLALIASLSAPSEKSVYIAARPTEASKNLSEKPSLPAKTSTATLPIRSAETPKVAAVKTPETKAVETEAADAKQAETKPASPVADPEKAKAKPANAVAKITPTLKKPADNAVSAENEIKAAVQQWAKAWAAQDVGKYLASYAEDFDPANGQSRSAWEDTRRERVSSPAHIRVDVSNLNVNMDGDKTARVKFRQAYRTGRATMRTDKVLIMKKTDNKWLIQQELTDR